MEPLKIVVASYAADILTPHYRVYGELRTRGDPTIFLNDQTVGTLTLYDAVLTPIRPEMRVSPMSVDVLHIPKHEPHIITLGGFSPQIPPLPKTEPLICFTDTYMLRGLFHMARETRVEDVFHAHPGPFFYVSHLDIASLYPLGIQVAAHSELGYIRGSAVRAFFRPQPRAGAESP
jgi:hypothetical protein